MMNIDNLDDMTSDELREAESAFDLLSDYCSAKRYATEARFAGEISFAMGWEKAAEGFYQQLPEKYRW